jgi:glucose-6-phosphate 1-epimerase
MITLYEYMQQPRFWIARDEDGYWLVPARDDGWSERSPFVGRVGNLRQLHDLEGIDLGLPDQLPDQALGQTPDSGDVLS